jgi:hypothetical protein
MGSAAGADGVTVAAGVTAAGAALAAGAVFCVGAEVPGKGAPTGTAQLWPGWPWAGLTFPAAPPPAGAAVWEAGNKGAPGVTSTTLSFLGWEQLIMASMAAGIKILAEIFMFK